MNNFVLKYVNPIEYFGIYFGNNLRQDNRSLDDIRIFNIQDNIVDNIYCYNSTCISLGNTKVLCSAHYSIGQVDVLKPNEGEISIHVDLSAIGCNDPNANNVITINGRNEIEYELELILFNVIKRCNLINAEDLVVENGLFALKLDLNFIVLCNDGNMNDACILSMVSYLLLLSFCEYIKVF